MQDIFNFDDNVEHGDESNEDQGEQGEDTSESKRSGLDVKIYQIQKRYTNT